MGDHSFFRQIARQCRGLLKKTRNPELFAQLRKWALECDRKADRALRTQPSEDMREQARRHERRAAEYRAVADQMENPTARASYRHLAATYGAMAQRLEERAKIKEQPSRAGGRLND
jgi:hypothetical protein